MPAEKRNTLTPQQRALVKALRKGMTLTDAALEAGYTEKHPGQAGYQALESIRRKMPEILDRHGLTDDSLIERYLKPGLEAKETEFAKFEGKITDSREVIGWSERRGYLDMAFKLRGSYAQEDSSKTQILVPVQIVTNLQLPNA